MTPITHDSWEWRDLQKTLGEQLQKLAALEAELTALRNQQEMQHGMNQDDIAASNERIEQVLLLINGDGSDDNPGLKIQMNTMISYGKASAFWGKVIAWVLGFSVAVGAFYVAWFESHHKITQNSSNDSAVHATLPTTYQGR